MTGQAAIRFPASHPAAAGHFPGNPIIPGALILDEVIAAIALAPDMPICVRSAKFLRLVRPGEEISLSWETLPDRSVKFECRSRGALSATGRLEIGAAS